MYLIKAKVWYYDITTDRHITKNIVHPAHEPLENVCRYFHINRLESYCPIGKLKLPPAYIKTRVKEGQHE